MKKRLGSVILALVLVMSLLGSIAAFAESGTAKLETNSLGTIQQDTTINGDEFINGRLRVKEGTVLTIPEGITLTLGSNAVMEVKGDLQILGRVEVQNGARVYMMENGALQEFVGPEEDIGTNHTPMIAVELGQVVLGNKAVAFQTGLMHVARSGEVPFEQTWYLWDEVSLIYKDDVSVSVNIIGPDTTLPGNANMMDKLTMGKNASNKSLGVKPDSIYWWLGWMDGKQPASWRQFDFDELGDIGQDLEIVADNPLVLANAVLPWKNAKEINGMERVDAWTDQDGVMFDGLVYDDSRDQHNQYNLYIPSSISKGSTVGVILFIHGGGWTDGERADMDYECRRYAREGYVTATLDYRLFDNVFPLTGQVTVKGTTDDMLEIIDDVGNCITAIKDKLSELGYAADCMALSGYSAGGLLSLYYGYAHGNDSAIPVKMIFEQCGPADMHLNTYGYLSWMDDFVGGGPGKLAPFVNSTVEELEGEISPETEAKIQRVSPIYQVTPDAPFTIMQYGYYDNVIGAGHEAKLIAALEANGVGYESIPARKSNHYLELDKESLAQFHETAKKYLKIYLGDSTPAPSSTREEGCPSASYADVPADSWFHDAADYVIARQIMMGTENGFEPQTPVTRGMMAQILFAMEGRPSYIGGKDFCDVNSGDWYADAVNWASANGIVGGFEDGSFQPQASITREQMAVMLYAYASYLGKDTAATADLSKFSDGDVVSEWAQTAMGWAVGHVLMAGRGDNDLVPQGETSRAEVATMIRAFCNEFGK